MTIEEIEQEIANSPDLLTGVVGLINKKGFVVRSQDEEKSYIENYERNVIPNKVSASIGDKVKEIATRYEQDLLEITGLQKEPTEKYYDFQKRVFNELKTKGVDKSSLDQLELYKGKVSELQQALTAKEESAKNEILSFKAQSLLDSALANFNIAFPAHLTTDEEKNAYKKSIQSMVVSDLKTKITPKDNNGEIALYEGDTLHFDIKTGKNLSYLDVIKKHYGAFHAPEQEAPRGMGTNPPPPKPNIGKMTRDEYYAYADSKGITTGSEAWYKGASEMIEQQA